jgi:hypothetical protein
MISPSPFGGRPNGIAEEGGDPDRQAEQSEAEFVPDEEQESQSDGARDDDELAPFGMNGGPAPADIGGDDVRLFERGHGPAFTQGRLTAQWSMPSG